MGTLYSPLEIREIETSYFAVRVWVERLSTRA